MKSRKLFVNLVSALFLASVFFVPGFGAKEDDKTITFAVCNLKVYEDSTKVLAKEVEKLGYKLKYRILGDGTQINDAVERGEAFANYHQHTPYMQEFNRTHKAHLAAAFKVFTDRAGLFSLKHKNIKDLPVGAKIVIPSDAGNNFRTFIILQEAGFIKLKKGIIPESATQNDIAENPKKFKFIEVEYELLTRTIEDADAGFLYATIASEIGLDFSKDVLAPEPEKYQAADIIAVREENLNSPKTKILKQAYYSDAVKKSLKDSYDGRDILLPSW
jgi:D-methionine transport system substrate-binding protein